MTRSVEEIAAERAAGLAEIEDQQREAVDFDMRCAAIGDFLMEIYAADEETTDTFKPYIEEGKFPEDAAQALAEYEQGKRVRRPDYDITRKPLRLICAKLASILEKNEDEAEISERIEAVSALSEQTIEAESTLTTETTNERAVVEQNTETAVQRRSSYHEFLVSIAAKPNLDRLKMIAARADAPANEQGRAQAFLRLQSLAQNEEGAALIFGRIETQDFSNGVPSPEAFIRAEIFSSSAYNSGVSEATQAAIAEVFDLTLPPRADTGSDVRALAAQMRVDPETGEDAPVYPEDSPAEFRPGVRTWTKTGEDVYLTAALPGHSLVTRDVTNWSSDDICLLSEAMGFAVGLEQFGATGFVEDIYKIDFSLLGDSAFDRESLREIRQIISTMVGSFEGYDGDIFRAQSFCVTKRIGSPV